jgi:hypothetical protein
MTNPSGVYKVFQHVKMKMCRRCNHLLRMECEAQTWEERYGQMCICIDQVLEPNDENYPVMLKKEAKH